MRDQYRALMLTSFKDATEIVDEYNDWIESEYRESTTIPPAAVPQIALSLYRSRVREALSDGEGFQLPDFDDKMYE